ncbi:hypothetical protein [Stackebrandtia soli]|uniref:hypothetical protein n=1 Tax=Stackebrandtia soli TaxID=1892856 RepID=UPI0039EB5E37
MRSIALILAALTLAACGQGGPDEPTDPKDAEAFNERAEEVAAAWKDADPASAWADELRVFDVKTSPPKGVELTEAQSSAFFVGYFDLDAELPEDSFARSVTLPDDSEVAVEILNPHTAFEGLAFGGEPPADCANETEPDDGESDDPDGTASNAAPCTVLTVTKVEAGSTTRWTNHGLLSLPAYLYTVDGIEGEFSQVAVALPERPELPVVEVPEFELGEDMKSAAYLVSMSDSQLEYTIGVGACDEKFRPLVHATDEFVIVAGSATYDGSEACTDQLIYQPVTVALDAPLGDRMVIDAVTGTMLTAGEAMF